MLRIQPIDPFVVDPALATATGLCQVLLCVTGWAHIRGSANLHGMLAMLVAYKRPWGKCLALLWRVCFGMGCWPVTPPPLSAHCTALRCPTLDPGSGRCIWPPSTPTSDRLFAAWLSWCPWVPWSLAGPGPTLQLPTARRRRWQRWTPHSRAPRRSERR